MAREGVTQRKIAQRAGVDVSSVNKILNQRPGLLFRKETVRKVFRAARDLGYDLSRLKHRHVRQYPRREVAIPVELSLFRKDGTVHDQGKALLRDLSAGGARVTDVELPQGTLPAAPFTVSVRPQHGPLEGLELRGRIVRILQGEVFGYGIAFDAPHPALLTQLRRVKGRPAP